MMYTYISKNKQILYTMKKATQKILLTKKGELNKAVLSMIANCEFEHSKKTIRTGYYSGSGRFTSANSAMSTITSILDSQGYKYTTSNDAPKGGIKGEFVKMSKTAYNFIINIKK